MNDLINLFNQAIASHQSGRIPEAINLYLRILPMQRDNEELLFTIGTAYCQIGQLEQGLYYLRKSSRINPKNFHAFSNMGRLLTDLRRFDEAIINYNKAIFLNPNFPEALLGRGNALVELKKYEEALQDYKKALELVPDFVIAHLNTGKANFELRKFDEALASYDHAIALTPDFAEAHSNRGNVFKELKQYEQALLNYNNAIQQNPRLEGAYTNRGCVFEELKRFDEAIADHDKAIALKPDYAEAYNNRGNALQELKRHGEALVCYDKAIALKPDYAEAYNNRGNALQELKRHGEALVCYDKAIALKPDIDYLFGTKLHTQMQLCDWQSFEDKLGLLKKKIQSSVKATKPFVDQGLLDRPDLQKRSAETYIANKYPDIGNQIFFESRCNHPKIKVGYFSSDFGNHPVTHLLAGLFEEHDRERFEIIAFSLEERTSDEWRDRVIKGVDHFIDVHMQSDIEIAELSRSLGLDIAVDLNGHTKGARTGIFCHRAAPIQASYIGFLGTMGANYFDYLIADSMLIPEENRTFYTEKIVYLPSYQCNDNKSEVSDKLFTRNEFGLLDDDFVFCSFNNNYKITPPVFDSWMRILSNVPNSVLWIYVDNEIAKINLQKEANVRGVNHGRLVFADRIPLKDHLSRQRLADLFLDTYPYNAGATASNALRVGLPLITRSGDSFASRYGASLLNAVGLSELVTYSAEAFESLAVELATQPNRLALVKNKLSNNLLNYPLLDTARFARNLESAFVEMHKRSIDNLLPDHIYIHSASD